jgi:hypothetical protein
MPWRRGAVASHQPQEHKFWVRISPWCSLWFYGNALCKIFFAKITLLCEDGAKNSVARWYNFKPKIPIWVNFGGSCNGRCWYLYCMDVWSIFWNFSDIFNVHLVYFVVIWYIFPRFGMLYQEKSGNPGKKLKKKLSDKTCSDLGSQHPTDVINLKRWHQISTSVFHWQSKLSFLLLEFSKLIGELLSQFNARPVLLYNAWKTFYYNMYNILTNRPAM